MNRPDEMIPDMWTEFNNLYLDPNVYRGKTQDEVIELLSREPYSGQLRPRFIPHGNIATQAYVLNRVTVYLDENDRCVQICRG